MKQENRFVAQLFHYLAPFVDLNKNLFICVDGEAARNHAGTSPSAPEDRDVPDLWFSLLGQDSPIGIEAKVIEGNSISVRQGQLRAWRTDGGGKHKPTFWVATNPELTNFYCWHQADMQRRLDASKSSVENVKLSLADTRPAYQADSVAKLALFILAKAIGTAG